ncbi:hypothetical protein [Granulosicoccus antarcticus]|uniref:GIY-YIG domain-containing protein n=1 Tax=Granulosicoccus antarcticus IMCC3135 TaxID=1192854 RepID=A0A2Z2P070_9GAMM|nr:hypothetical protein [Granulosicoccus antarcticus]ASJ72794.1 hypothetical protein IMCC3135_13545 [Granulosicoccus antarcticus IMCC3135]
MQELESFLKERYYFPRARHVEGRASIAGIYGKKNRCGIYVLRFLNGEVYAGKSTDVTRRYVQHRIIHNDISHISFKRVPKSRLSAEEKAVISGLEDQDFTLRNIALTSIPKGVSDFDLVMPLAEQDEWVQTHDAPLLTGTRIQDETLRQKYQKRFKTLASKPYAEESTEFLRRYVQLGLPVPIESEYSFWSCSCLPTYSTKHVTVYSRINVYWQEVLTVINEDNVLWFSFHLARSPLELEHGKSLDSLKRKHRSLQMGNYLYETGGSDQVHLEVQGYEAACQLLKDPTVLTAIRLFNLRLIKKGLCNNRRYHCMDLADRLLG